jgi:hypothetical protein
MTSPFGQFPGIPISAAIWRASVTGDADKTVVARANLVEHLKNIDIACEDARLSAVEKIKRIKEEVGKAQDCLKSLSL